MIPHLSLTRDPEELAAALALRRAVFADEMGACARAEADAHDTACEHLIMRDASRPDRGVIGTLRLAEGCAYTAREFDLSGILATGRPVAEAGRSCLHPAYRGGMAGLVMLHGLLDVLRARGTGWLVGTASFPGADPVRHMPALRALRARALAPEALRPVARGRQAVAVAGPAPRGAMRHVPPLIKTYLRAGARVGEGAWVDRAFNTVDICVLLDLERVTAAPLPRLPQALAEAAPAP